jgi:glyoxylase-like metal-dependent hydrolase (beta-lactamase superfamily II)
MTGSGNWTYFLPGQNPVLIDAGTGLPEHLEAIATAAPEGPRHVVVTHAHGDHASGVPAIRSRWPATAFSKLPWPGRDDRYPADWQALRDGDVIPAGDADLTVVHTPGHAPDHVALWDPRNRVLFSGDLITLGTTVVILASHGGSLAEYLASLRRVQALAPARLLPAHGAVIDEPAAVIQKYLEHRAEREAQVVAGLRAGQRSIDALVAAIYRGLQPALVPMARESVLAHLIKLEHEGRVRREGEEWME